MCQLFAFSSSKEVNIQEPLKNFYKESVNHHDGWGLVTYQQGKISKYLKEGIEASKSDLCQKTIQEELEAHMALGHIRKASRGDVSELNTHPFKRELEGNVWVFCHNGTVDCDNWNLKGVQAQGTTDSEKIFCTLLNNILENPGKEKLESIEKTIENLSPYGKLNLIFTDGKKLYVQSNREKNLYFAPREKGILFATRPVEDGLMWKPLPIHVLFVYEDGKEIYKKQLNIPTKDVQADLVKSQSIESSKSREKPALLLR